MKNGMRDNFRRRKEYLCLRVEVKVPSHNEVKELIHGA